ncbi:MAG TPA: hypothetical protein VF135_09315, partial [Terriglobales bacterium]
SRNFPLQRGVCEYMRRQRVLGLVIAFTSLFSYVASTIWLSTRTFTAYDRAVTTWPGHISTGDFKINYSSDYWPQIVPAIRPPYDKNCDPEAIERASKWTLYKNGKPAELEANRWWIYFDAGHGTYRLEVDVPQDAACLANYQPRLIVSTGSHSARLFHQYLTWVVFFLALAGVFVAIRANVRIEPPPIPRFSITGTPSFDSSPLRGLKRSRFPSRRFKTIPAYGVIASSVIVLLIAVWWFIPAAFYRPYVGIWVGLAKPHHAPPVSEPHLVVRIDREDKALVYTVGNEKVPFAELTATLKRHLSVRADWTIYLDASGDITFQDAVDVIDLVRDLKGRVVLLPGRPPDANRLPVSTKGPSRSTHKALMK